MTDPFHGFDAENLPYAEQLYQAFLRQPHAVDEAWAALFQSLDGGPPHAETATPAAAREARELQNRVDQLVQAYRAGGHLRAALDPLGLERPPWPPLEPRFHGIEPHDLSRHCAYPAHAPQPGVTVDDVLRRLRETYTSSIGAEVTHLDDAEGRRWLIERMESTLNRCELSADERRRVLERLVEAEVLETFIQRKWPGAKTFSLEGAESLIPLLDLALGQAARHGVRDVVIGMAHRGRLNVLVNVLRKPARELFRVFEDLDHERYLGRGDVKYHLGHRGDITTQDGRPLRLLLAFNPSHLEFVCPVVLGRARARQDRQGDTERVRVLPILIHGDAAFAGQGIVPETLNLSALPGYATGGTLHVIVNNQIGFTTPPASARSSCYATDVARMLRAPIFHVNGEDPESVAQVVQLAIDFRARFRRDVFIDLYCYRRHGHNEGDEPAFTQPLMVQAIRSRPPVHETYRQVLGASQETVREAEGAMTTVLEQELTVTRDPSVRPPLKPKATAPWDGYRGGADDDTPEVMETVPVERLQNLLRKLCEVPRDMDLLPQLRRVLSMRRAIADGARPLDWAAAEALAFASLLVEGHPVRLSGQDSSRGTFSHRHAVVHDQVDGGTFVPLQHLAPDQASFEVWDSPLSEAAVLGFDYGYSLDRPDALILWEAQFGDFANVAQVLIDQFVTSAEDKWGLLSGLVLLLPHGFEGQGPEHSSARLERFLQLCAEDNIQVVYPTTPAQLFHCLRRQVVRPWRKPLVVMSPKGLLRHPLVCSSLNDLAEGGFQRVMPDPDLRDARRVLLCSGKVYVDLAAYRDEQGRQDVGIIRIEQLYPFPDGPLSAALSELDGELLWVQEEPRNMGAWTFVRDQLEAIDGCPPIQCVAREASASPATGSPASHAQEQRALLQRAFA